MDHQFQDLPCFGLELESFDVRAHPYTSKWSVAEITGEATPHDRVVKRRALYRLWGGGGGNINLVDSRQETSTFFACLPAFEIGSHDEEFASDLNDANALFLNDSAEMPHRESGEFGCIRDIQERFLYRKSFGRFHRTSFTPIEKHG